MLSPRPARHPSFLFGNLGSLQLLYPRGSRRPQGSPRLQENQMFQFFDMPARAPYSRMSRQAILNGCYFSSKEFLN